MAKFAFDFGRLPLHWYAAKAVLQLLGYKELLVHSQREILAALRLWLMENTHQVEDRMFLLWSTSSSVRCLRAQSLALSSANDGGALSRGQVSRSEVARCLDPRSERHAVQ